MLQPVEEVSLVSFDIVVYSHVAFALTGLVT
jgi:hypothetical protein